ncbi:MAG: hypothetical protein D6735_07855, partial [Acidobacteria bacterium]
KFHSNGILIVISLAWFFSGLLLSGEETRYKQKDHRGFIRSWFIVLSFGLGVACLYWILHASLLASIVASPINNLQDILNRIQQYEGLLLGFYVAMFAIMILYMLIPSEDLSLLPRKHGNSRSIVAGFILIFLSLIVIYQRNLRVIQADIAFKLAESFAKPGSWPVSIQIYQHAIDLAPREDYYYLFLGRSYIEYAREINDDAQREALFEQAKSDLLLARSLNPLNTDHTANLARLYSQWTLFSKDEKLKRERFNESDRYFAQAVSLSPNNSRLWGEWAVLLMSNEQTHPEALQKLMRAYQLDPNYDWIAYLFGEYYRLQAARIKSNEERASLIETAISNYLKAASLTEDENSKHSYLLMAAQLAIEGNLIDQAIQALENALAINATQTEKWRYEQTLAQLYLQIGQMDQALFHANHAFRLAPQENQMEIQDLINQITQSSE